MQNLWKPQKFNFFWSFSFFSISKKIEVCDICKYVTIKPTKIFFLWRSDMRLGEKLICNCYRSSGWYLRTESDNRQTSQTSQGSQIRVSGSRQLGDRLSLQAGEAQQAEGAQRGGGRRAGGVGVQVRHIGSCASAGSAPGGLQRCGREHSGVHSRLPRQQRHLDPFTAGARYRVSSSLSQL